MKLSQKQENFSEFFSPSWKCRFNLKNFQKNMTLIAYVFLNLQTPKNVIR